MVEIELVRDCPIPGGIVLAGSRLRMAENVARTEMARGNAKLITRSKKSKRGAPIDSGDANAANGPGDPAAID